ncbi:hypothetical protein DUNSADRAFT_3909 [Dunaliella salina]|uniref:CNNM transmembrane domain-containing protein n=1 Tax=Dunaliella salina TaxID=3046 RepID=A0ABQ7GT26_DUNSA|nr:hypothetical protein DUNSADRAFT_3909 [Dunaliella salina]|eukprot:KAF5837766.1 hypothetical protein DUNSADRAFT_3909 [Dunaliella salina]
MSGLTLGLMSLDMTQMEVLKRSGTPSERMHAQKIMPVIQNSHFLLVTLLLCNAGAMEALPLFLDRLANPITAIILSATAVLFFGEIIPQSVCTRYGLVIGANLAWLPAALVLMMTTPGIGQGRQRARRWPDGAWPDLPGRQQLKALVDIHGEERGMGGKLSADETKVITGALDLTNKIAYRSMTPLDKVFMLSTDDVLNDRMLRAIVESGHSRVPIHRAGDKSDLVGLILVKELLQYKMSRDVPVCLLKMRSLPSHMAVLTQPMPIAPLEPSDSMQPGQPSSIPADDKDRASGGAQPALATSTSMYCTTGDPASAPPTAAEGAPDLHGSASGTGGAAWPGLHPAPSAPELQERGGAGEGAAGGPAGARAAGGSQRAHGAAEEGRTAGAAPGTSQHFAGRDHDISAAPGADYWRCSSFFAQQAFLISDNSEETTRLLSGAQPPPPGSDIQQQQQQQQQRQKGKKTEGPGKSYAVSPAQATHKPTGRSATCPAPAHSMGSLNTEEMDEELDLDMDLEEEEAEMEEEMKEKEGKEGGDFSRLSVVSLLQKKNKAKRSKAKELQARRLRRYKMVPQLAPPGQPIGIITIEDVIEELIRAEIVDETDRFVDNEHMVRVEQAMLESSLPERLRRVVTGNVGVMLRASFQKQHASSSQQHQHQQQHQQQQHQQQQQQHGFSATTPLLGRQ